MKATSILTVSAVLLLSSMLISPAQPVPAAAPAQFDHAALMVADLHKSAHFYEKVIGLQPMASPFPAAVPIVWFGAGDKVQLHLIQGDTAGARREMSVHMAFRVADLDEFMKKLQQVQVKYRSFNEDKPVAAPRPDGVRQIYLQDPDGYWIEINDARY